MAALEKESLFRNIGTVIKAYDNGYRIFAKDNNDLAEWVTEGDAIQIYEGMMISPSTLWTVGNWPLS